jgi:ADP-ribosylglycohydrolase
VWIQRSKDIGIQTRRVFAEASAEAGDTPTGGLLLTASLALYEAAGHTAGNGSLMRTAPVVLAHLDDIRNLIEVAHLISHLTHGDPTAEVCAL